ncbi:MAG: glycosyltransferase family 4 protein [bacterium]
MMSAAKLVFVSGKDPLSETMGGHSSYVRAYARAACAAGYSPEIFCVSSRNEIVAAPYGMIHRVMSPFAFYRLGEKTSIRSRHAGWHVPLLNRALRRHLAGADGPVILHGFSTWGAAAVDTAGFRRQQGRPVRSIVNSYTVYKEEYRSKLEGAVRSYGRFHAFLRTLECRYGDLVISPLERRAYTGADLLLVNYRSVQRFVEQHLGPVPQLQLFPYASELAFLPETPGGTISDARLPAGDEPLIVSVSRHDPRKGLDIMINALCLLRQRGVAFRACILSGGELLAANRRLALKGGLDPSQVMLPGYVRDIQPYLRAADIFCLPSYEEHSGSVSLLEAMQCGRAIVASGVDGIPEDVDHERHAWLVPPRDPVALAAGLQQLLTNPQLRARLGQAARARYTERFAAGMVTHRLGALYDSLTQGMIGS